MSLTLRGRVVVISPHLDDGVLSLGGAVAEAGDRAAVRILTVMAGDPDSTTPAGPWDAAAGFATAGEAARARRQEDRAACAAVGAEPVWLPFGDEQYDRGGDDAAIWAALLPHLTDADVLLIPGTPLTHADHRWLSGMLLRRDLPVDRVGIFVEQPYAATSRAPAHPWAPGRDPASSWTALGSGRRARRAKRAAIAAYRSQLPLLTSRPWLARRITRYEAARGGESVGWVSRRNR
jgi:LmbE family N-acetylglucosaminyl deacetylase